MSDEGAAENGVADVDEARSTIIGRMRRITRYSLFHIPVAWVVREEDESHPAPVHVAPLEGEVVMAQRVGFFEGKRVVAGLAVLLVTLAVVLLSVVLSNSAAPTAPPTALPTAEEEEEEEGRASYCDPCIDRTTYTIRAVLSGADDLLPSVVQAASDMRVNLDLRVHSGGGSRDEWMSDNIRSAADPGAGVDALVVTIPSKAVANAVHQVGQSGMPVFGMKSGFEWASGSEGLVRDGSVFFFVATDERSGGEKAASYFLELFFGENADERHAENLAGYATLFISPPRATDPAYQQRFEGYRDRITEAGDGSINVESFQVTPQNERSLREKLSTCTYQSVLVGQGKLATELVYPILIEEGCYKTRMGSFDTSGKIQELIAKGKMEFAIGQSNRVQGYAPVHMAALYLTTGLVVAPPPSGVYMPGPVLLTKKNFTRDGSHLCRNDAPGRLDAECIHGKNITVGGVVHGRANTFWETVIAGAKQGAIDMGVELKVSDLIGGLTSKESYAEMATNIRDFCDSGVDGLFVTLPDDVVVAAVRYCKELNPKVQIMSIHTGYVESKDLDLIHHLGMVEEEAGNEAGNRMARMATFNNAICLNFRPDLVVFQDRCAGFRRAMDEAGIGYSQINGAHADAAAFISTVEAEVGESGDWADYGILLTGVVQLPFALKLKEVHGNFALATFGADDDLYDALDAGSVLFGTGTQQYLLGYLPIPILAHAVAGEQSFLDHLIRAGPGFIIGRGEKASCESRDFPVCPEEGTDTR